MTAAVVAADFDAFFAAVYPGKAAFPWQRRLAAQVCATGAWPPSLDLPTGTGKTAVLDIAVFAMAIDAGRPPEERRMPRRAILVVDRRTVVDQAHERALALAHAVAHAAVGSILDRVAQALHSLRGEVTWTKGSERRPLEVAYLRGAIPRDDGWAGDPSQPMLGVSTVDQVGSRLLFRGYGVSPGMRSIHAGLLGNDVVYFLDEVHLSQPFAQTLAAVTERRQWAAKPSGPALHVVTMSATHRTGEPAAAFALADDDRRDRVLRRRLEATKPVSLEEVKVAGDEARRRKGFSEHLAGLAMAAIDDRHRRIAVVVNRVDTALAVHERIDELTSGTKQAVPVTALLVTGRMRPLDREDREHELRGVQAGVARVDGGPITIVIATQCIEAGADLDFDVMITECASLDAVVQRFGRLDRLGDFGAARGVIAIRSDHTGEGDDDPVYGPARAATWRWLVERAAAGELDFGLNGRLRDQAPAGLVPPGVDAPVLRPADLDLWSQTRPAPYPDPDVALWLHGPKRDSAEVSLVWRADLTVAPDSLERLDDDTLEALFEASPPLRQEALAVPLWAAEAWLRGGEVAGLADVEGESHEDSDERTAREAAPAERRWVIRWAGGDDGIEILNAAGDSDRIKLRPGDTLIVPSAYGGIRAGTWAADSKEPVVDRGDEAQLRQRHRLVVRLDALAPPMPVGGRTSAEAAAIDPRWTQLQTEATRLVTALGEEPEDVVAALCKHLATAPAPAGWLAPVIAKAGALKPLLIRSQPEDGAPQRTQVLLVATRLVKPAPRSAVAPGGAATTAAAAGADRDAMPEISSEDDSASRTGVAVTLAHHLAHVAEQADAFARSHGLPVALATDVVLAAAWHDAGKADPRFQLWLADGDEVALAAQTEPLAKSAMSPRDRRRQRAARQRARYPRNARHELISVALLEGAEDVLQLADDRDLVLHLIASHHGWCRPYAPVEAAGPTVPVTLIHDGVGLSATSDHGLASVGASVVDRFWRMTERYGWWGLAWLETLVRLADHRASHDEQLQDLRRRTP